MHGLPRLNGEPFVQMLHLGARAMLVASGADRAGLWLSGGQRGESGPGCAIHSDASPIPEQWNALDISAPFLRAALESSSPLRVDLVADEVTPQLGPLTGMHSVIWVPLRAGHHTVGLGMVGYTHSPEVLNLNLDALRTLAEEIAISVQYPFLSVVKGHRSEDAKNQLRLFRCLQADAAGDSAFRQIARTVRNFSRADFIAMGDGVIPPLAQEGWNGPPDLLPLLRDERVLQMWHKAQGEGRKAEISGEIAAKIS